MIERAKDGRSQRAAAAEAAQRARKIDKYTETTSRSTSVERPSLTCPPGQLSLAIPAWLGTLTTSKSWGVGL